MASTFTTNKSIEKPANGDYNDTWNVPVNADFDDIDNALGGSVTISVTGVAAGNYPLTLDQYQPPNIAFTGALIGNLLYQVPTGVGGLWTVFNNTSGSFSLTFGSASGGSIAIPQGQRFFLVCDGANMQFASTPNASANPTALVGPIAVNGSAGTFMRSDAAPRINPTSNYSWSGVHTFNGEVAFDQPVAFNSNCNIGATGIFDATAGFAAVATRPVGDNTTQAANTAFVHGSFAPLSNPALSGTPTAPTAAPGTNTTQIASTAFVHTAVAQSGSLGVNGWHINQDGSIEQWGTVANGGLGPTSVTFPIPYPTACWNVVSQCVNVGGTINQSGISRNGFVSTNGAAGSSTMWRAIGN